MPWFGGTAGVVPEHSSDPGPVRALIVGPPVDHEPGARHVSALTGKQALLIGVPGSATGATGDRLLVATGERPPLPPG